MVLTTRINKEEKIMADKDLSKEIIKLELTVDQINSLLAVLGNAPFVQSANLVNEIQAQGTPQFLAIQEANKEDEPAEEAKA